MSSDSEKMQKAWHDAQVAIDSAQELGLLERISGFNPTTMGRLEMLSQAFVYSRNGAWFRRSFDLYDWEFAQMFGYVTRLAIFEMTCVEDKGWQHFRQLFRHYFGPDFDKLAPSVFLAAVFHPGLIVSRAVKEDVENIMSVLEVEQTAFESLNGSGLFD